MTSWKLLGYISADVRGIQKNVICDIDKLESNICIIIYELLVFKLKIPLCLIFKAWTSLLKFCERDFDMSDYTEDSDSILK